MSPRHVLEKSGFSGDVALNPATGAIHVVWVRWDGALFFAERPIGGDWSDPDRIFTNGLKVYSKEPSGPDWWARKCCGLTVDNAGVTHVVYGVSDGDLYYTSGSYGDWDAPLRLAEQLRSACHPEIVETNGDLYVIYEDARKPDIKRIYEVTRIDGRWSSRNNPFYGDNPDLIAGGNGMIYLTYRLFNSTHPDFDWIHDAYFAYKIPGMQEWVTSQVTHSEHRVGKASSLWVDNDRIYMAWSTSIGELADTPDEKGRLYCARADEPGIHWDVNMVNNPNAMYTVATGDPYGRVCAFSDGTVFYTNGKEGDARIHSNRFYTVWKGTHWGALHVANWIHGQLVHLATDGKNIWAIASSSGVNNHEVSVTQFMNPEADYFVFGNSDPEFTVYPDTVARRGTLWRSVCKAMDPEGGPVAYSLVYGPEGMRIDENTGALEWQAETPDTVIVGVRARDNAKKFAAHYFNLVVLESLYDMKFEGDMLSGDAPLTVAFTNASQGDFSSQKWNFGDGTVSDEINPVHTYHMPGTYSVTLTLHGIHGTDSLTKREYIHIASPPVSAGFTESRTLGVAPLSVQFHDTSTGSVDRHFWDFGDGQTSTQPHPLHLFQMPGEYSVTLTVSNFYNESTVTKNQWIQVFHKPPVAKMDANVRSGYTPFHIQFGDSSAGEVTSRFWDFGDGNTSIEQHPRHTYEIPGLYTVRLVVHGPGGSDSLVHVHWIQVAEAEPPAAAFSVDIAEGEAPLTVQFTDQSSGTILGRAWHFGDSHADDGGISEAMNPAYTYQHPGTYTVMLTLTGQDTLVVLLRHNLIHVHGSASIRAGDAAPDAFRLYPNHPNPFNASTTIVFDLPGTAHVHMSIYNAMGEQVAGLLNATVHAGHHQIQWEGANDQGDMLPSGIYIVRLVADGYVSRKKMIMMK